MPPAGGIHVVRYVASLLALLRPPVLGILFGWRLDLRQVAIALFTEFGKALALHAPDGTVHPGQGYRHQHEQHHVGTGPDAGEIEHGTEQDRQEETAQAADHADQAAYRA